MADLKLNTTNGSVTLKPEDGSGNVDVSIPRAGVGKVLQVQHVQCSPIRYTISVNALTPIPDLLINFTPKSSTSKILLQSDIYSTETHVTTFGFLENINGSDTVLSNVSNTNTSGSISTTYKGTDTTESIFSTHIAYMVNSTGTSTRTFKVGASSSWANVLYTLYINDRGSNDMRSVSSFTITEIEN